MCTSCPTRPVPAFDASTFTRFEHSRERDEVLATTSEPLEIAARRWAQAIGSGIGDAWTIDYLGSRAGDRVSALYESRNQELLLLPTDMLYAILVCRMCDGSARLNGNTCHQCVRRVSEPLRAEDIEDIRRRVAFRDDLASRPEHLSYQLPGGHDHHGNAARTDSERRIAKSLRHLCYTDGRCYWDGGS